MRPCGNGAMQRRDNVKPGALLASSDGQESGPHPALLRRGTSGRFQGKRGKMVEHNCVFCRIIGGEEMVSLVHEDDRTLAFLDIQPMNKGHTLIVTKDHHETLFDMPEELAAHCLAVARRIAPGIQRAMNAQAINIFSANGKAGGQDVPHFHLHLIPVREGEPFALQLPLPDAPIPSRADLDITAARVGRAIQETEVVAAA
jgi:histidine triad (HIT) family protein